MATTNNAIVPGAVFDLLLALMINRRYPHNILTDVGIQNAVPDSDSPTSSSPEYFTAPQSPLPSPNEARGMEPMSLFKGAKDFEINHFSVNNIARGATLTNNYGSVKYLSFATLHCSHLILRAQLSKSYRALRRHTTTTHARSRVVPALAAQGEVS